MPRPILPALRAIAVSLAAVPSLAQDPAALRKEIFQTVTEVNVVNIDVTVTDRRGEPVGGLARDDFVVRENGELVEITNFFAVEDGSPRLDAVPRETLTSATAEGEGESATPAAESQRHLLIYVDNANLAESNRARVFSQLRDFLLASLPPRTRVMVATNDNGTLRLRLASTPVLHDLFYALDQIQGEAAARPRLDLDERDILRSIEAVDAELGAGGGESGFLAIEGEGSVDQVELEARSILPRIESHAAERQRHVLASLAVLRQFVELVAGLPGQRALLYVSDGLELRAGEALLEAYARRFAQLGGIGAEVRPELTASRYEATRAFEELVTKANTGRIAFYALDAAGADTLERGSAATSASAGGLFASWDDGYASTREEARRDALRQLAEQTGGRAALGPAAVDALFEGLADDFANRYSLGYPAGTVSEGAVRRIEVSLRQPRPAWTLRYRRSFRDLEPSERAAERTRTALLVDDVGNALEIAAEAAEATVDEDGGLVVPLLVQVPLGKLVLVPGAEAHRAQVSLFVAVRDDRGRTSQVGRHLCPIRISNDELLTALGQTAVCGVRLSMRRGAQRVGVSVLDEIASNVSTTHLEIDPGAAGEEGADTP